MKDLDCGDYLLLFPKSVCTATIDQSQWLVPDRDSSWTAGSPKEVNLACLSHTPSNKPDHRFHPGYIEIESMSSLCRAGGYVTCSNGANSMTKKFLLSLGLSQAVDIMNS